MDKIKRISRLFRLLFQILFVALPIIYAYGWVIAPKPLIMLSHMFVIQVVPAGLPILHSFTTSTRIYGFLATLIPVGMTMLGLVFLIKLFRLYEQGIIFASQAVSCLRRLGYVLLVSQVLQMVYDLLISLTVTWHNPVGHRMLAMTITGTNIAIVLAALLLLLISWIMAEACKLQEEQQLTI